MSNVLSHNPWILHSRSYLQNPSSMVLCPRSYVQGPISNVLGPKSKGYYREKSLIVFQSSIRPSSAPRVILLPCCIIFTRTKCTKIWFIYFPKFRRGCRGMFRRGCRIRHNYPVPIFAYLGMPCFETIWPYLGLPNHELSISGHTLAHRHRSVLF